MGWWGERASSSTEPPHPQLLRRFSARPAVCVRILSQASRSRAGLKGSGNSDDKQQRTADTNNDRGQRNRQQQQKQRRQKRRQQRQDNGQRSNRSRARQQRKQKQAETEKAKTPAQQTTEQERTAGGVSSGPRPTPPSACITHAVRKGIGRSPGGTPATSSLGPPEVRVGFRTAPQTILRGEREAQVAIRRGEANGTTPLGELRL